MGTIRKISDLQLGSINSSKILSVSTAETLYVMGTGNRAVEFTNLGSYIVYYGNSGFTAGTGGVILQNGSKMWDSVVDNFQMALKLNSAGVTSQVVAHEYAGN